MFTPSPAAVTKDQKRLEFDFVSVRVKNPSHQIIPIIPEGMSIPAPTDMDYIQGYLSYLMTGAKTDTEDYTYGERLVEPKTRLKRNKLTAKKWSRRYLLRVNQIEEVIKMYKEKGHRD